MAVTLTDRYVQALRADGRRLEVRDAKVPGLVLRVTPTGAKSWSLQFRRKGHNSTLRLTLGTFPETGIARARERARDARRMRDEGGDPIAAKRAQEIREQADGRTFEQLLEEYFELRRGVVSMTEVERELRKDVLPTLGDKHPALISPADIDRVVQTVLRRGAPTSARRIIIAVKALYNFLIFDAPSLAQRYGITTNPAELLGRRRRGAGGLEPPQRQRVLSEQEMASWWKALDASALLPAKRLALKLVLVTAQRPGEVRKSQKSNRLRLDGPEPTWTLLEQETKARRRHIVPLSPLAVALWHKAIELSGESSYVFQNPDPKRSDEPLPGVALPTAQANIFRNHLPEIEPATVHDLRRSAATGMRRIGVAPHVVSQILNHVRPDVTGKHYDFHEGLSERRAALELWAERLNSIGCGNA